MFFLLLFSLFLYEEEPEPVKKKYLEPEPVKSGPAPQHCHHCQLILTSVVDPNTLDWDPHPDFWPNLDPDSLLCDQS